MCAPRIGRRELGQRGGLPAKQSPRVWLQKRRGWTECVRTGSGTYDLERYKLTDLHGEQEGWRTTRGRVVEPRMTELSLAGNKGARQCHLLCPSPSQNPKGNQFLPGNLLAQCKHPTLCFCRAKPPAADLTPSSCHRTPPEVDHLRRSELSLPLLPPCTLPTHPS